MSPYRSGRLASCRCGPTSPRHRPHANARLPPALSAAASRVFSPIAFGSPPAGRLNIASSRGFLDCFGLAGSAVVLWAARLRSIFFVVVMSVSINPRRRAIQPPVPTRARRTEQRPATQQSRRPHTRSHAARSPVTHWQISAIGQSPIAETEISATSSERRWANSVKHLPTRRMQRRQIAEGSHSYNAQRMAGENTKRQILQWAHIGSKGGKLSFAAKAACRIFGLRDPELHVCKSVFADRLDFNFNAISTNQSRDYN